MFLRVFHAPRSHILYITYNTTFREYEKFNPKIYVTKSFPIA